MGTALPPASSGLFWAAKQPMTEGHTQSTPRQYVCDLPFKSNSDLLIIESRQESQRQFSSNPHSLEYIEMFPSD